MQRPEPPTARENLAVGFPGSTESNGTLAGRAALCSRR